MSAASISLKRKCSILPSQVITGNIIKILLCELLDLFFYQRSSYNYMQEGKRYIVECHENESHQKIIRKREKFDTRELIADLQVLKVINNVCNSQILLWLLSEE